MTLPLKELVCLALFFVIVVMVAWAIARGRKLSNSPARTFDTKLPLGSRPATLHHPERATIREPLCWVRPSRTVFPLLEVTFEPFNPIRRRSPVRWVMPWTFTTPTKARTMTTLCRSSSTIPEKASLLWDSLLSYEKPSGFCRSSSTVLRETLRVL